jgi:PAS domain S-box-containing protein
MIGIMSVRCLFPLFWLIPGLLAADDRPRVLMLFSNDRLLPANQQLEDGVRRAFGDGHVDLFGEFLDAVRFPGPAHGDAMERFLAARHRDKPLAACICVGPQALEFLSGRRQTLFEGVPVILAAVTPAQLAGLPGLEGVTGRPMEWSIRPLLDRLPEIRPEIREVLVVTGASEFDALRQKEAMAQVEPYRDRYRFDYSHGQDPEELKRRVAELNEHTLVFYISYFTTPDGRTLVPQDVARDLAAASSVPVVCVYDTYLGTGVLGGPVVPFEEEGRVIGGIARQVVEGGGAAAPGLLPAGEPRLVFDERVLKRFGWKLNRIPSGSEMRYHEASLWEKHRTGVLTTGGVVILQSTLIVGLLAARSRQRAAERERSLSESRFSKVFLGSPVPISIFRQRDGRIVDVNPAWEETMGVARERALGATHKSLGFIFGNGSGRGFSDYLASGKPLRDFEQEVGLPDGKRRQISVSTELLDLHGEPCYVSMAQDVTARHQADEARRMMSQAARLGILGELTASIAHEVNQPLGAILSNAEAASMLMDSDHPPLDEIREILADIRRDDLRAGDVIRQVRSLVARGEPEMGPLAPADLVASALRLVGQDCKRRGISIDCRISEHLPQICGEKVQLEQVLLNLLLNAMEAVADQEPGKRSIHMDVEATAGGKVDFIVADSGPGIAEENITRVFENFFSTKSGGMGLGLALSRSIAEAHGGRLEAEGKTPGGGARFHFILPAIA